MWSQSAGSGLACISCVTGTNAPDCAATQTTGPADPTAKNKNETMRYALFIVLPPLDGWLRTTRPRNHFLWRIENARPDRPSRERNQSARRFLDSARADEWRSD